ncbi:MBL fold metallo-hydrolase [Specibacter sp. RAF43]|uniref:MBL fold metallo-hydrolase n=1 Tax=Specibacter sp. RAF43 TaxID=3233057 RepID=UPI003F96E300
MSVAIEITGAIQKQAWIDKVSPPVEQVSAFVWSVAIDFRENPVRHTFCYILSNESGECLIVDPGWESDDGWDDLTAGLALAGLSMKSIVGIVSTHYHPDHLGMVGRLAQETGAWIGMHEREVHFLDSRLNSGEAMARDRDWLIRCGVAGEEAESLILTPAEIEYYRGLARPTVFLQHGDALPLPGRNIRVIATPGHTAGHLCIVDLDSEVIFTGDHVLPRITPNIGINSTGEERNALEEYYQSLDLMIEWDAFEVCPAHEYRFRGLAERSRDLKLHHQERSQEILDIASATPGLTAWQVAERLTWSRGWTALNGVNLRAALSETLSHLEYLVRTGRVSWDPDDDLRSPARVRNVLKLRR